MSPVNPPQADQRTYLFRTVFVISTVLAIVGDVQNIRWLHYGCKPLIMFSLLSYSHLHTSHRPSMWLGVGMILALLGDVCLMIREVDLFVIGLGAFLVMQLSYSMAFWQSIRRQAMEAARLRWPQAVPFALYLVGFLILLYPAFEGIPARQPLWWPVVVYAGCLCTMGFLASQCKHSAGSSWVTVGALLFMLSDSAIAVDKFLTPIPGAAWLIMSTYAAAQYLIVFGLLR